MGKYYTYIVTNKTRGALYTGMSNTIERRTLQHKQKINPTSFTARYKIKRLVWFESFPTPIEAIRREKEIKGWRREKKIELIEQTNPEWKDLFGKFYMKNRTRNRKMTEEWNTKDTN